VSDSELQGGTTLYSTQRPGSALSERYVLPYRIQDNPDDEESASDKRQVHSTARLDSARGASPACGAWRSPLRGPVTSYAPIRNGVWWQCSPNYVSAIMADFLRSVGVNATAH
jgi:hypothetical protein